MMPFLKMFPEAFRATVQLRLFGLTKIPLLFFIRPSVVEISERRIVIRVRLRRRTKNHLGAMYFGVLAAGAECAGGLLAMRLILNSGGNVSLVFRNFSAEFLKRAEGDALFTCEDGEAISRLVREALDGGERVEIPVRVTATVPGRSGDEPVARFLMTLSLKRR
jgi:acyl-coenzyme A thioesterase PaaI-like protein